MTVTEHDDGERRLAVDHELCSGTRWCQEIAPEVFHVEGQRSWLAGDLDLAAADPGKLAEAQAMCPWMAITFDPGEGP